MMNYDEVGSDWNDVQRKSKIFIRFPCLIDEKFLAYNKSQPGRAWLCTWSIPYKNIGSRRVHNRADTTVNKGLQRFRPMLILSTGSDVDIAACSRSSVIISLENLCTRLQGVQVRFDVGWGKRSTIRLLLCRVDYHKRSLRINDGIRYNANNINNNNNNNYTSTIKST